jgi:spermidine synthase
MARKQRGAVISAPVDSGTVELAADPDRPNAWTLLLDGVPQSHVDLDRPDRLEFEYVRRVGHLIDLAAPPGAPLRALHLGGGGCTLPRYIAATRPRSGQQVVELDAALVAFVREHLPFPRDQRVRIRTGDARSVLERVPEAAFDLVVCDVFAGGRTPAPLTTVEFAALAARALRPRGIYVANVADGAPLAFARAQAATVGAVLPHACLIAEPAVLRGRRFGNLVLAAARHAPPVPYDRLTRRIAADPFQARLLSGEELTAFIAGAPPTTDATARPSPEPPAALFR